ncbi:competence protein TfoX [Bacteroidia bacterium]|nr:competence protein TfoX [Bacteroidia bacterium]
MKQHNDLTSLSNIGKVIAARLREVGIETPEDLKTIGSENAFIRLKTVDEGACINELLGLEGAIQGVRDHDLDENRKSELKAFYKMTKINTKIKYKYKK